MSTFTFKKSCLPLAVATLLSAGAAQAQIDEIVVTATKSEQTLQSVPVAVSVISAEAIEAANVVDLMDLKQVSPSFDTRQNQTSLNSSFWIRGFGGGGAGAGIEPAVAVVVDGVYRTRVPGALDDLPVVEQIEILRGPQSTLFGKSASAGVVSIKTKEPSHESYSKISLSTGNYNLKKANYYSTFSATENLAIALSGSLNKRDGFFENQTAGVSGDVSDKDRGSFRADFLYTPAEDLSVRVIAETSAIDETCCGVVNTYRLDAGAYAAIAASGGSIPNAATDPDAAWAGKTYFNFLPTNYNDNDGISIKIDKDLGWGNLTSMTAYRTMDYATYQDVDFDSANLIGNGRDQLNVDSFQQELRLSFTTANVDWTAGLFYSDEDIDGTSEITLGSAWRGYMNATAYGLAVSAAMAQGATAEQAAALAPQDTFGLLEASALSAFLGEGNTQFYEAGQGVVDSATQSNQSLSLFLQGDIQLNDQWSMLVGVSRLEDDKKVSLSQEHNVPFSVIPASLLVLNGTDVSALQYLTPTLGFENKESSDSNTDYTVKLSYEASSDLTLYAGVATGYKASSWDLSRDSKPSAAELAERGITAANNPLNLNLAIDGQRYAKPEESRVYELGAKVRFSNGYMNLTYFDQEVENFQTTTFVGGGYAFSNAPLQTSNGIEFESFFALSENLSLALGGIFHDPKYGAGHVIEDVDLSHTTPSRVSKRRLTAAANYTFDALGFENMLSVSLLSESDYTTLENPEHLAVLATNGFDKSSKDVVNLNLSMAKGASTVSLWANNVFDEQWMETTFISPGTDAAGAAAAIFSGYPSAPRTFGATYSYEF